MKNLFFTVVLIFIGPIFVIRAQREYSYCRHEYCRAIHIYEVPYKNFSPFIFQAIMDQTSANPYLKLTCPSSNKLATKNYWAGYDSLEQHRILASYGGNKIQQETQLKMAIIYFRGAIQKDKGFCDAYDNLVNCYFLTQQYDSALQMVNKQRFPSFHSSLAKGVIYYEIYKDYVQAEQYFQRLSEEKPTAIYLYYLAQSQIKLTKLTEAKVSVSQMETTLKEWGDGWAMMQRNMLIKGVIACKEADYDTAYKLLDRIKRKSKNDPIYCHYYAIVLQNKSNPSKGKKFMKRAVKLKYDPNSMI